MIEASHKNNEYRRLESRVNDVRRSLLQIMADSGRVCSGKHQILGLFRLSVQALECVASELQQHAAPAKSDGQNGSNTEVTPHQHKNNTLNPESACLLMTSRETAAVLRVCEKTLYTMTKSGEIRSIHIGRGVRYSMEDIKKWIAAQSQKQS